MPDQWFYARERDANKLGPFSSAQLRELEAKGFHLPLGDVDAPKHVGEAHDSARQRGSQPSARNASTAAR